MDELADENTTSFGSMDPENKSNFEIENWIRQAPEKDFFDFMVKEFGDEVFGTGFKAIEANRQLVYDIDMKDAELYKLLRGI